MSNNPSLDQRPTKATTGPTKDHEVELPDISSMKIEDPLEFSDEYKRLYAEYLTFSKVSKSSKYIR